MNSNIIIIYGPTGVGKTDFAIELAQKISGEIINMDIGQFYLPLTIGTAKPDWKSCFIPHHGFDIIEKPKNFSVPEYRLLCGELISAIEKRGNVPILVGGSGFYLKSLFFPPTLNSLNNNLDNNNFDNSSDQDNSEQNNKDLDNLSANMGQDNKDQNNIRNKIANFLQNQSCFFGSSSSSSSHSFHADSLASSLCDSGSFSTDAGSFSTDDCKEYWWKQLFLIDPTRASEIDSHDMYRIKRALTIWFKTNKKPSEFKPVFDPIANSAHVIFLTRERKELYDRINERVDCMMNAGWLAEVEALRGTTWHTFIKTKKIIGYAELLDFLAMEKTEQSYNRLKTAATIKQKTRNYAKRQGTFWRMFSRELIEKSQENKHFTLSTINMTLSPKDVYFNELVSFFLNLRKKSAKK